MNKQIDRQAEMLKIIEDARETYANDVTDHTENEYIREGLLNANYRKTEDVAREIFEEIESKIVFIREVDTGDIRAVVRIKDITKLRKKYESEGVE